MRRGLEVIADGEVDPRVNMLFHRRRRAPAVIREVQRDAAVALRRAARRPPRPLRRRAISRVEVGGPVAFDPRRQDLRFEHRDRQRRALQLLDRIEQRVERRARPRPTPCHSSAKRPSASARPARPRAAAARATAARSVRSTSASHHSRCVPPGRNSPSSTRPRCASRPSTASATARPRPKRARAVIAS